MSDSTIPQTLGPISGDGVFEPPEWHNFLWCIKHVPGDLLRYLYFMRFSLLLWLSMPVIAVADLFPGVASVTRGILTPSDHWQWIFSGFAVTLPGWFALLASRIVCSYGPDRFGSAAPPCFTIYDKMEGFVFWGAQLPGLLLLLRIAYNVVHEGEGSYSAVIVSLASGVCLATIFWHVVAVLYYWTYDPKSMDRARAFLVPKWRYLPLDEITRLPTTGSIRLLHRLLGLLCVLGPGYERNGALRPGHMVASIALLCAVVLYWLMMPISAPVPLPRASLIVGIVAWVLAAYVFFFILLPASRGLFQKHISVGVRVLPFIGSCSLLALFVWGALQPFAPRAIPVIAYVSILLTVVFWMMAGLAFFADHYRIPVLTLCVAILLLLNLAPAEHVFPVRSVIPPPISTSLPDPSSYVKRIAFNDREDPQPVIIITATGGGIHSAAWTATVLSELEREFGQRKFYNHVLLISTVSGGSIGAMGFLREYFTDKPFDPTGHSLDRIRDAAQCSSLQAVAWGLAYPDTLRLVFPWFFNIFPSLDRFDRGWALEQALQRNMHDPACFAGKQDADTAVPDPSSLTLDALARLQETASPNVPSDDGRSSFPAFTFNTTVVETGDRFLLSNYSVFVDSNDREHILPAASFLGVYAREALVHPPIPDRGGFADISLLTAARLSASFTYVSPAARLPFEMSQGREENAYHFVDGGYYDNDGTNSVIEFLRAASSAFSQQRKLPVLLLEIRNGDNIDSYDSPDSYAHQGNLRWQNGKWQEPSKSPGRWGPVAQMLAPPKAAVQAGFSSVTRRNRRELDLLIAAYSSSLDIKHIVLDYQQQIVYSQKASKQGEAKIDSGESELDQPLSWHLTKRQQLWINGSLDEPGTGALDRHENRSFSDRDQIHDAVLWFDNHQPHRRPDSSFNSPFRGK